MESFVFKIYFILFKYIFKQMLCLIGIMRKLSINFNAAVLVCCEAPEMWTKLWTKKLFGSMWLSNDSNLISV